MILRYILKILILFFLINCSGNLDNNTQKKFESPESQYVVAMSFFNGEQFEEAKKIFKNIEKIYPLSNQ